jgi:hypothetical protein
MEQGSTSIRYPVEMAGAGHAAEFCNVSWQHWHMERFSRAGIWDVRVALEHGGSR